MDEYMFHHFLIVIIGENERDRHQVGGKRLSLFPTHVSWLFVDWFTLMVGLNWTSWPLYGIRAYVIPHVTPKKKKIIRGQWTYLCGNLKLKQTRYQKKKKKHTLCHWTIEDHIMSKILFSFLHITYTKKVMIQIQKFCLVMQQINLSKLWIILNR